jgi:uncharacterized protein YjbI with pentapeptide repeats
MPQPQRLGYRNCDLRNRSFKHQDLTGANFSHHNLSGCDFSGAVLTRANFQGVDTAQSRSQVIVRRAIAITFAMVLPFAAIGALGYTSAFGYAALLAFAILIALPIVFITAGHPLPKEMALGVTFISCAFTATITLAIAVAIKAISVFSEINFRQITTYSYGRDLFLIGMGYLSFSLVILSFGAYGFLELLKILKALPGTMFENADLSEANFSGAVLQNADFSGALLNHVNWTDAEFYHCKFPRHFENDKIQALCTSRDGYKQDYSGANLKSLYLANVDLTHANLSGANLNGSDLQHANLEKANLQGTQALSADFSNAVLTGACIKNWGINAATRFDDVHCDYIYLEPDRQERRPSSGIFQPGDFAKLVHQFSNTLDFLFRNGIDPEAFDAALRNLLNEYPNAGLSLHSLADVGDGYRLVKLNVANLTIDKTPMHSGAMQVYAMRQKLKAARQRTQALQRNLDRADGKIAIYEKYETLWQAILGKPTVSIRNSQIGDVMPRGNEVNISNTTGNISNLTGGDNSGVFVGGDISGTLTFTIDQLEASKTPEALKLADLLKQLKAAIEKPDAGLDAKDKEKALKHLNAIAKLGNDPQNADLLEKAGDALDALPTIIKRGNGLLEFAEKHLPTILSGVRAVLAPLGVSW